MGIFTSTLLISPRNFHDEATLSSELAPVDGFPIDNTQNTQRSRVWRSPDGTDQYWQGTYDDGLARTAGWFSFFRHRCHGGNVRLRLYSDAAWGSVVYDSGTLAINNLIPTDGFDWGIDPYGDGSIDPLFAEAPYWLQFAPTEHLSYRVNFTNNVSTYGYAYWQICRVFLGPYKSLPYTALYDYPLQVVDQTDRNRSRGGSLRTNQGPNWRTIQLDIKRVPQAEAADWLDIKKWLGTGRDCVMSLYPGDGTRMERDHLMNCKLSTIDPLIRWHPDYFSTRLQFEEV